MQGDTIKRRIKIKNRTPYCLRLRIVCTRATGGLDRSLPLNEVTALFPKTGAIVSVAAGLSTEIEIKITGRQFGKILETISIHSEKGFLNIRVLGNVVPAGSEVYIFISPCITHESCLSVPLLHDVTTMYALDEQAEDAVLLPPNLTSQDMEDFASFPRLVKECSSLASNLHCYSHALPRNSRASGKYGVGLANERIPLA